MRIYLDTKKVRELAKANGWREQKVNNSSVLIFNRYVPNPNQKKQKLHQQVDVYFTTGTVKTTLTHPTKKRNAMFRPACTMDEMEQIFENPRVHLYKGYRSRDERMAKTDKDERMKMRQYRKEQNHV